MIITCSFWETSAQCITWHGLLTEQENAERAQGRKWKWSAHYYAMHLVVLSKSTDFTKLDFRACFSHLFFSTLPRKGLNKSPIQQLRAIGSEILHFLQFNFMVICLILIIISRLAFSFVEKRININAYYTRSHQN